MSEWINIDESRPSKGQVVEMKFNDEIISFVKYDPLQGNDFWLIDEPYDSEKDALNPKDYDDSQMIIMADYDEVVWRPIKD